MKKNIKDAKSIPEDSIKSKSSSVLWTLIPLVLIIVAIFFAIRFFGSGSFKVGLWNIRAMITGERKATTEDGETIIIKDPNLVLAGEGKGD